MYTHRPVCGGEWVYGYKCSINQYSDSSVVIVYYTTLEFMDVNLRGQEWFNYT